MSGHSKFANIKHKKGKSDAQKAKVFTKLGREIQIAVKSGGPDPETNSKLKDVIVKAKKFGNAVTSMPYNEQIFKIYDDFSTKEYIPRETLRRVSTPQAYNFKKLYDSYEKAFNENIGIGPSSYTNTMMVELGETLYFAAGSDKNIKLTTKENLEMFKAFLKMDRDDWLK